MDPMTSDVGVIKSEPEIIVLTESGEQSPTSPCDAILQCGIFKQEKEDASEVKCEPGTLAAEEHLQECGAYSKIEIEYLANTESESSLTAINAMTSDIGVIKFEPEIIFEEESPTSPCDAILQCGIFKQDTEDASEIKCEPGTLAAEEHVQESGADSKIDINYPDIKKECFVYLEKIDISREYFLSTSPFICIENPKTKISVKEQKSLFCPYCSYRCSKKSCMVFHIRTHTGEKPFSCSECKYQCIQKHQLVSHLKIHTGKNLLSCSKCTYKCIQKTYLVTHMKTHTGEKPFSCSECSYRCIQKTNLVYHMKNHTGEKPFSCSECTYRCSQKHHMVSHMTTHNEKKAFSCSECTYTCSWKGNLVNHIRTHTGEKPFSCSECTYTCRLKRYLVNHARTHTQKKPENARTHTGDKPFSCSECTYTCNRKNDLVNHARIHTGNKPFSCSKCTFRCSRKNYMVTHNRIHALTSAL